MSKLVIKTDDATVNKAVQSAITSTNRAVNAVRHAAMLCVLHAVDHGNVTPASTLCDGINGLRQHDLRNWFMEIGCMIWDMRDETVVDKDGNEKTKQRKGFVMNKERRAELAAMNRDELVKMLREADPFAKAQGATEFKPFNFKAEMAKLLSRARKAELKHDDRNDLTGLLDVMVAVQGIIGEAPQATIDTAPNASVTVLN